HASHSHPHSHSFPTRRSSDLKIISIPGSVRGGPGDDTILGGVGRWKLEGGDGNDTIRAWASSTSSISGGDGDDTLIGGSLNDRLDRKSTRLNSSHGSISYAVF